MEKTKVIQTPKGRLLVVGGLPEAYSYDIYNKKYMPTSVLVWVDDTNCYPVTIENLPLDSNYELLGKLPDITEEQAKEVVQKVSLGYWMDYLHPRERHDHMKTTAKNALLSLVASEVSLENKFGEEPKFNDEPGSLNDIVHQAALDAWEQEQEKVFTNPILFFEPKNI